MVAQITDNIKIAVEVSFVSEESDWQKQEFLFSYAIAIENLGQATVQLISRHWHIVDASGNKKDIFGEGVVGQQPIIKPKEQYRYTSYCVMKTPIGSMVGSYLMQPMSDNSKIFSVHIPKFDLVVPIQLN